MHTYLGAWHGGDVLVWRVIDTICVSQEDGRKAAIGPAIYAITVQVCQPAFPNLFLFL